MVCLEPASGGALPVSRVTPKPGRNPGQVPRVSNSIEQGFCGEEEACADRASVARGRAGTLCPAARLTIDQSPVLPDRVPRTRIGERGAGQEKQEQQNSEKAKHTVPFLLRGLVLTQRLVERCIVLSREAEGGGIHQAPYNA